MKIKNIIRACKERARMVAVYTDGGGRWLGDGASLWLMPEDMSLEEETIYSMYDFTDSQRGKIIYEERGAELIAVDLYDDAEREDTEMMGITFTVKGEEYRPIKIEDGVIYIKEDYFNIFNDEPWQIWVKHLPGGKPYIAIYKGLIQVGIIMPCNIETEDLSDTVSVIAADMKVKMQKAKG